MAEAAGAVGSRTCLVCGAPGVSGSGQYMSYCAGKSSATNSRVIIWFRAQPEEGGAEKRIQGAGKRCKACFRSHREVLCLWKERLCKWKRESKLQLVRTLCNQLSHRSTDGHMSAVSNVLTVVCVCECYRLVEAAAAELCVLCRQVSVAWRLWWALTAHTRIHD